MKVNLVVLTEGKMQGQNLPIKVTQFIIGRDPQCNLRPASAMISKRHCSVMIRDNQVFLRDFESTNGTFVNDQPIKGEVQLVNSDTLRVGPLSFRVEIEAPVAPSKPTPPPPTKKPVETEDGEDAAAMLLSLDSEDSTTDGPKTSEVPSGSTVFDLPAIEAMGGQAKPGTTPKPDTKKPENKETASQAAASLLEQFRRGQRR